MSSETAVNPWLRIRQLAETVGLDEDFADFAVDLYDQVDNDGGYAESGVPGVVYAAVRIRGDPVKPAEIANVSGVGADRVTKDMRRMVADLPFDVTVGSERRFVYRYVDELDVDDQFRETALSLCDDAMSDSIHTGRAPSVFAASVVYAASVVLDAGVEQREIADVANVTTTIIRRYYRDIIAASGDASAKPDDIPAIVDTVLAGIDGAIPDGVRRDAKDMAASIDPSADWVRRCDPKAVGAAIAYVAAKRHRLDVTQAEVGEPVGMSRHAVNARSQDVKRWDTRRRLEAMNYNPLKELAAEAELDVGMAPGRPELIDRLVGAGVDP